MSVVTVAPEEKAAVSRRILEALPEWFGVADAREAYIREAADLPMIAAKDSAGLIVGFATHRRQTEAAIELHLIAVLPAHHRQGHGRALVADVKAQAELAGASFLTVKTLAPSHPNPNYAATRRFYETLGFKPVEVFPSLWGAGTPCLLMAQPL